MLTDRTLQLADWHDTLYELPDIVLGFLGRQKDRLTPVILSIELAHPCKERASAALGRACAPLLVLKSKRDLTCFLPDRLKFSRVHQETKSSYTTARQIVYVNTEAVITVNSCHVDGLTTTTFCYTCHLLKGLSRLT